MLGLVSNIKKNTVARSGSGGLALETAAPWRQCGVKDVERTFLTAQMVPKDWWIATLRLAKKRPASVGGAVSQNHIPVEKCNAPHRFLQDQTCASSLTDEASTTKLPKLYMIHRRS